MDSVRNRLANSKVKDRLLLTGFVDYADLAPLYQGAVAFRAAYLSLQEGFGLPVLEALQCGAVVVTANNSSLPEVGADAVIYCDAKQGFYRRGVTSGSRRHGQGRIAAQGAHSSGQVFLGKIRSNSGRNLSANAKLAGLVTWPQCFLELL